LQKEHPEEAIACYQRALAIDPHYLLSMNNLANVLKDCGRLEEAFPLYDRVLESASCVPQFASNRLASLQYAPAATLQMLDEAHREYDQRFALPFRAYWESHPNAAEPDRPIRLGFISPHFRFHPVGHFLVRLLENLDRREFEVFCYDDGSTSDAMTARLQAAANSWQQTAFLSDGSLDRRVRDDHIDILFDLAGHTAGNRLLVFARKPAPIQITWLDYVGTTGLSAIDYILADPREIPPEAEKFCSETVLRLADDYVCFDPPANAPGVGPPPALANGFITFASFNIVAKMNPQMVKVWSRVMARVPGSRLVLKNRGFESPAVVARMGGLFAEHSIDPNRIRFAGWSPPEEVLAEYGRVDIALDTFPYNGGLTTCEALWMGVPVVTCPGETFASRHGLAHLTAAGVTETIAHHLEQYEDLAVDLAHDLPRLVPLRASLRDRVAASALCDGPRFAGNFSTLMRQVWRKWCAAQSADRSSDDSAPSPGAKKTAG
jgi:predicted O-linked N-acetylglucosamine transferase (SPINDLY family)